MAIRPLSERKVEPDHCGYFEKLAQFAVTHDYFTQWTVFVLIDGYFAYREGGGEERVVRPGDILLCPPFTVVDKAARCPVTFWYITFKPLDDEPIPLGVTLLSQNERILEDFRMMTGKYTARPAEGYNGVLMMDIWFQLAKLCTAPMIEVRRTPPSQPMRQVFAYIENNLARQITLGELASCAGWSAPSFIQKFRLATGQTPMEYVTCRRIDRAKGMVLHGKLTLREIASLCGFANEFYLSRVFRRVTGMSPTEYRKNHFR